MYSSYVAILRAFTFYYCYDNKYTLTFQCYDVIILHNLTSYKGGKASFCPHILFNFQKSENSEGFLKSNYRSQ